MERIVLTEYLEQRVWKIDVFLRYHHMILMRSSSQGDEKWHQREIYALLRSRYELELVGNELGIKIQPISARYEQNIENHRGYRTLQSYDKGAS